MLSINEHRATGTRLLGYDANIDAIVATGAGHDLIPDPVICHGKKYFVLILLALPISRCLHKQFDEHNFKGRMNDMYHVLCTMAF
eukprot:6200612-Pleurochrysis_carterae.AAC.3